MPFNRIQQLLLHSKKYRHSGREKHRQPTPRETGAAHAARNMWGEVEKGPSGAPARANFYTFIASQHETDRATRKSPHDNVTMRQRHRVT